MVGRVERDRDDLLARPRPPFRSTACHRASDVRGSFILPRGTIVVGGAVTCGKPIVVAVIGGTGAYAGARGTLELRSGSHNSAQLVFQLRG